MRRRTRNCSNDGEEAMTPEDVRRGVASPKRQPFARGRRRDAGPVSNGRGLGADSSRWPDATREASTVLPNGYRSCASSHVRHEGIGRSVEAIS